VLWLGTGPAAASGLPASRLVLAFETQRLSPGIRWLPVFGSLEEAREVAEAPDRPRVLAELQREIADGRARPAVPAWVARDVPAIDRQLYVVPILSVVRAMHPSGRRLTFVQIGIGPDVRAPLERRASGAAAAGWVLTTDPELPDTRVVSVRVLLRRSELQTLLDRTTALVEEFERGQRGDVETFQRIGALAASAVAGPTSAAPLPFSSPLINADRQWLETLSVGEWQQLLAMLHGKLATWRTLLAESHGWTRLHGDSDADDQQVRPLPLDLLP
jgi:hypothetical protein